MMKNIHFVGIGGIGMSGLASMSKSLGYSVTGSDRGADLEENQKIFTPLKNKGINIYPQDGSYATMQKQVDFLVYSSAIEDDNLDMVAMPQNCQKLHRSQALQKLINESNFKKTIAISGSCGKSSVCGLLSETINNLTGTINFLNGAIIKKFANKNEVGNFFSGKNNDFFVFEADESDKSLINYSPDYAILLNIGTDHYSKDELAEIFSKFINNVKELAVISNEVYDLISSKLKTKAKIVVFSEEIDTKRNNDNSIVEYKLNQDDNSRFMQIKLQDNSTIKLSTPGFHNGLNALAIYTLLKNIGFEPEAITKAMDSFSGVARRFDFIKKSSNGALIYDDYAHNPEKILSCLKGARELAKSKIFIVFQPHGYTPLKFMQAMLFKLLDDNLIADREKFIMLEPYYAGGTSSMSPHSIDVIDEFKAKSKNPQNYLYLNSRDKLATYLQENTSTNDIILIMGARDNSLPVFARSLK